MNGYHFCFNIPNNNDRNDEKKSYPSVQAINCSVKMMKVKRMDKLKSKLWEMWRRHARPRMWKIIKLQTTDSSQIKMLVSNIQTWTSFMRSSFLRHKIFPDNRKNCVCMNGIVRVLWLVWCEIRLSVRNVRNIIQLNWRWQTSYTKYSHPRRPHTVGTREFSKI